MSFQISSIARKALFLAVDIGAFRARAMVCRLEQGEVRVLSSASVRQTKRTFLDGEIADLGEAARCINRAITQACERANLGHEEEPPQDIILGINSDFLLYDTLSMNYVRDSQDDPITMSELDTVISRVEHRAIDRIKAKIEERLGVPDTEMKLVTTSITSITLDGQKVMNPVGFTGKNIRLQLMNVFVPLTKFTALRNIIRSLGKNLLSVIPVGIALPKLLEDSPYALDPCAWVDIGYGRTTVSVSTQGELIGINTIGIGSAALEKTVSEALGKSSLEAEHLLQEFLANKDLLTPHVQAFAQVLAQAITVWVNDVTPRVHPRVLVLSGGIARGWFVEALGAAMEHASGIRLVLASELTSCAACPTEDTGFATAVALARVGQEMNLSQHDPVTRVLRSILYRYE